VVRRLQRFPDGIVGGGMTPLTSRFESIEEAQEYLRLLREVVDETRTFIGAEIDEAAAERRRADALRLVDYKLTHLCDHLRASSRLLNDLRTLRRVLYGERDSQVSLSPVDNEIEHAASSSSR
jgi:hypothetical protein